MWRLNSHKGRCYYSIKKNKKELFKDIYVLISSVNTPTKTRGVGQGRAADLTYWEGAARVIAAASKSSKIVVEKSTVPVKTSDAISKVDIYTYAKYIQCTYSLKDLQFDLASDKKVLY